MAMVVLTVTAVVVAVLARVTVVALTIICDHGGDAVEVVCEWW